MSKKTMGIVAVAFLLAIGAGALLGVGVGRHSPQGRPPLAVELGLSGPQEKQMKEIWSKVAQGSGGGGRDHRSALAQERDEAIKKLIPEDQKAAYDKIMLDYKAKLEELNKERASAFQEAVKRTKEILNETQRQKYAELLKRRGEHGQGPRDGSTTREGRMMAPVKSRSEFRTCVRVVKQFFFSLEAA